jgi:hypothetical protein
MDATPKLAEGETPAAGEPVAARAGSSSSSSSDEEKRKKAAKSKSRSVSRGKRASLFGGLLGKKDKEPKEETDAVKTEPEVKKEEPAAVPAVVPHLDESEFIFCIFYILETNLLQSLPLLLSTPTT